MLAFEFSKYSEGRVTKRVQRTGWAGNLKFGRQESKGSCKIIQGIDLHRKQNGSKGWTEEPPKCSCQGERTARQRRSGDYCLNHLMSVNDRYRSTKNTRKNLPQIVLQQGYVQRKKEKGNELFSNIRAEFTESVTFEKGHENWVATNRAKDRAFLSCVLIPLLIITLPTNSSEITQSFAGLWRKRGRYSARDQDILGSLPSPHQLRATVVCAKVTWQTPFSSLLPSHLLKTLPPIS